VVRISPLPCAPIGDYANRPDSIPQKLNRSARLLAHSPLILFGFLGSSETRKLPPRRWRRLGLVIIKPAVPQRK
jgi:hypothetical protein